MAEKTILELGGKQLFPRELTVREVDMVMEDLQNSEIVHQLEAICPQEPVSIAAVALSIGPAVQNIQELAQRIDELNDLVPSQIAELFKQVRVANPFLAESMENLAAIGRKLHELESQTLEKPSTTSDDQSPG